MSQGNHEDDVFAHEFQVDGLSRHLSSCLPNQPSIHS